MPRPCAGVCRLADDPLLGDQRQERHKRRAGVHDYGVRDQEPHGEHTRDENGQPDDAAHGPEGPRGAGVAFGAPVNRQSAQALELAAARSAFRSWHEEQWLDPRTLTTKPKPRNNWTIEQYSTVGFSQMAVSVKNSLAALPRLGSHLPVTVP